MIALNETVEAAAEIPFFLPDNANLPYGLTGHAFTLGEVKVRLPSDSSFSNATVLKIVEKGFGWYALRLTALQCAVAGVAYVSAVVSGAQPAFSPETIGTLGGDIGVTSTGYIPFFLPNHDDPVFGSPITGHVFVTGEVKLCLPDFAFANVDVTVFGKVIELGNGGYALALDGTDTINRGKAFIFVDIGVTSQPYSAPVTILGVSTVPVPTPPTPAPVVVVTPFPLTSSQYFDHTANAFTRLTQMFKGASQ